MDRITSRQFLFFIPAVVIVSSKTYSSLFTHYGMRDTWIATIIALIVVYFMMQFMLKVCQKKNCYDIHTIFKEAFGKVIGTLLLYVFYFSLFITLIESTSVEAGAMHYNFLIFNPVWGFLLLSVIAGFYVVAMGYRTVVITVILGIVFISGSGFILAALTHMYKDFSRLLPILENGLSSGFLLCILKLIASFSSVFIIFPLLKDVVDKEKLPKMFNISYLYSAQIHVIAIIGSLTTFEVPVALTYPFVKLTQTERIMLLNFLEAGELFVMLQIVVGWIVKFVTTFFILVQVLKKDGKSNVGMCFFIALIVYGASFLVGRNLFFLFECLNIYVDITFITFFVIPLITFVVYAVRGKKRQDDAYQT